MLIGDTILSQVVCFRQCHYGSAPPGVIPQAKSRREHTVGSRLVAFPVGDKQTILVEVDDPTVGNQPVARGTAERARETFETAIAQVRPGVEALMAQLRDLIAKPEQVSLEFGIKFTAGADALIAKTSVEGNVKVTLTWKPQ